MSVYMFALSAQDLLALIIVADLLVAISLPIKHRIWSLSIYIPLVTTPAFIFGITFVALSNAYADPNLILPACNPLLSMNTFIADIWLLCNFGINAVILLLYAVISALIRVKAGQVAKKVVTQNACVMRKKTDEQKVLSSLSLMISVFELSWCSFITCHLILNYSGLKANNAAIPSRNRTVSIGVAPIDSSNQFVLPQIVVTS
ncbi:unnamed protein product, partial [Mesorhabditis belari]|uniref:G-protein coupled receptors family 1 profile domain-containing protein n=1 Tax=Mesorhabditis belari TaxID=2138241 RepID=A0AAF3J880_9BILA